MAGKIKARVCFASLICTLMLLLTSCGFRLMSKREVEEYLEKQYGQKFMVIKSLQSSLCFWLCLALLQHFTYWKSFGESRPGGFISDGLTNILIKAWGKCPEAGGKK